MGTKEITFLLLLFNDVAHRRTYTWGMRRWAVWWSGMFQETSLTSNEKIFLNFKLLGTQVNKSPLSYVAEIEPSRPYPLADLQKCSFKYFIRSPPREAPREWKNLQNAIFRFVIVFYFCQSEKRPRGKLFRNIFVHIVIRCCGWIVPRGMGSHLPHNKSEWASECAKNVKLP